MSLAILFLFTALFLLKVFPGFIAFFSFSTITFLYFFFKQIYYIQINDQEIKAGYKKLYEKDICLWDEVVNIEIKSYLHIVTRKKAWKSPRLFLLKPNNLADIAYVRFKNKKRDLQVLEILLEGKNVKDISEILEINENVAQQIVRNVLKKINKIDVNAS